MPILLLGDHLGSTSLAVDAATGDKVETRYKPWGEVRFTTPNKTLPTRYSFTGQYSHVSDDATDLGAAGFGLLFYNSRWYDPALGRMVQADSIVPGGVQGLDRYSYVGNNPVRNIDPTGHKCVGDPKECEENGKPINGAGSKEPQLPGLIPDFGQYMQCSATDARCIFYTAHLLGIAGWQYSALQKLYLTAVPEAIHGVNYILSHGIKIVIEDSPLFGRPAWFIDNTVHLVLDDKKTTLLDSPWALQTIIHEALHIEQGFALSHSVEGERLAWQAGLKVYKELSVDPITEFAPGSDYQNILDAQDPAAFEAAIWNIDYLASMIIFYPEYPGGFCGSLLFCFYISINSR